MPARLSSVLGPVEGIRVRSRDETTATKVLRTDGDNTSSWQLITEALISDLQSYLKDTTDTFTGTFTLDGELAMNGGFSEDADQYTATTGTRDLDVSVATYFYPSADLGTATITFTFSNPPSTGRVASFTMELLGADGATLYWPGSVSWVGGAEPTWTAGTDFAVFWTRDNGTTWIGALSGSV